MLNVTAANPLRAGLRMERTPEPCVMVIFGASGDLTQRKLIPALYNLANERLLPGGFSVVGFARREWDNEQFRSKLHDATSTFSRSKPLAPEVWQSFADGLFFQHGDYDNPDSYAALKKRLDWIDRERGTNGNRVYYLATPPDAYATIANQLGRAGLTNNASEGGSGWTRIIVEKPFGRDLESAHELNQQLQQSFAEHEIYRIDHYLGKETVQNILVFRFANGIFEPIWNRQYVDHVQITVGETVGVEGRGGYYERSGVIRDMVQNHMLQLLTLVGMEPPTSFDADTVRDEKVKVLRALRPIAPDDVDAFTVRGQYGAGAIAGETVPGYREEEGVDPHSNTETFAAFKFFVDSWRWAGVPFYLRSGKRLPKRITEIAVQFREAPHLLFRDSGQQPEANLLVMKIQPDEGISLRFSSKVPGAGSSIRPVTMDFRYGNSFGVASPEAYERLLLDCMLGDSTLFTRNDEVEAQWSLITPIIEGWHASAPPPFANYEAGVWGPRAAHEFIAQDGRSWRRL
jgi:glucose-6-phosphate 1-dehydrogenase